ncbi:MAG: flagellar biosynthetic protein FliR [Lachnospiraceae bacterium]|nr:flagellar biosynthetic protein FliR [Lachnospiraceae bacterium]
MTLNFTFSLIDFEYFLLVLVRIASFVAAAPFFSMRNVPRRVRVGLSLFVAMLVYYTFRPVEAYTYVSVIGYATLVLKEAITGLLLGFSANICTYIIMFAGNIIDMDIGLSMASQFDPSTGSLATLTGQLYYYYVYIMLIVTGMYQYILRAIVDSFQLIQLGGANVDTTNLIKMMTVYMTHFFTISFRIMLPVFACTMIINVVLGVIAKVAPQMNMFSVGIQIKLLAGFSVLFIVVYLLPDVSNYIFKEMRNMLVSMMRVLQK